MLFERKRILVLVLCLVLVFSLAACGSKTAEAPGPAPAPVSEANVVEEAALDFFAELPGIMIAQEDYIAKLKAGEKLYTLDIRSEKDYAAGHVAGAINAPWGTMSLPENLASIPMDETVYVYCYTGQTAGQAVGLLKIAGYDVKSVRYGWNLGISKVEGYESFVSTEAVPFGKKVTTLAPELTDMVSEYYAGLATTVNKNYKISEDDLNKLMQAEDDSIYILSIRQEKDFVAGHIAGAANIPFVAGMQEKFGDLPKDKTIVVYCYSGQTAGQAVAGMRVLGYDAISLNAGMGTPVTAPNGWANKGFEVVK